HRLGDGRRAVDLVAAVDQDVLQQHPHIEIVLDKQDPAHQRLLTANGEITGCTPGPLEAPAARTSTIKLPCRSTGTQIYPLSYRTSPPTHVPRLRHFGHALCGSAERPAGRLSPAAICPVLPALLCLPSCVALPGCGARESRNAGPVSS